MNNYRFTKNPGNDSTESFFIPLTCLFDNILHFYGVFVNIKKPTLGFHGGSVVKNLPAKAGDTGLIPGLGRSPGKGNGSPLQDTCLGNPVDRGAWQATVPGVAKESDTT